MSQLPEKIDRLVFSRELKPVKSFRNNNKITPGTKRDLCEYFTFLEDVLPDSAICKKRQLPVDKVFTLHD